MKFKIYLSGLLQSPMPLLLGISLCAWVALYLGMHTGHSLHPADQHPMAGHMDNPAPVHSGWSWLVMLVAMMTPVLAGAIRQLWVRSLPRRRIWSILIFVAAYMGIWMLTGAVLISAAGHVRMFPEGYAASALVLLVTFGWQASPWRQACLNRCHWHPRLAPIGLKADWDCLQFGAIKGFWCVGSCWALMFLPLIFNDVAFALMLVISVVILAEQYQPARPARWQIPFWGRLDEQFI